MYGVPSVLIGYSRNLEQQTAGVCRLVPPPVVIYIYDRIEGRNLEPQISANWRLFYFGHQQSLQQQSYRTGGTYRTTLRM